MKLTITEATEILRLLNLSYRQYAHDHEYRRKLDTVPIEIPEVAIKMAGDFANHLSWEAERKHNRAKSTAERISAINVGGSLATDRNYA